MTTRQNAAFFGAALYIFLAWFVGDFWLTLFCIMLFMVCGVPWEIVNMDAVYTGDDNGERE